MLTASDICHMASIAYEKEYDLSRDGYTEYFSKIAEVAPLYVNESDEYFWNIVMEIKYQITNNFLESRSSWEDIDYKQEFSNFRKLVKYKLQLEEILSV